MKLSGKTPPKKSDPLIRKKGWPPADEIARAIIGGDNVALARAITLIESTRESDAEHAQRLVERCLAEKREGIRIGISGAPGVGKSTFIDRLGKLLTAQGKKVAVLVIDPTSTLTRGSILGDKTRMPNLVRDPNAFIRPSPAGETLGGVARKSREAIVLCEAAGYGILLIETVGVGQNETAVHGMVDFFLLLQLAGAGDELQGIKRGIMEMADAVVINKSDGDNIKPVKRAVLEYQRAMQLYPPKENGWIPKVMSCSSLENEGIDEIWQLISGYVGKFRENGYLQAKRTEQLRDWLMQALDELLQRHFLSQSPVRTQLRRMMSKVENHAISPYRAAEEVHARYLKELAEKA